MGKTNITGKIKDAHVPDRRRKESPPSEYFRKVQKDLNKQAKKIKAVRGKKT